MAVPVNTIIVDLGTTAIKAAVCSDHYQIGTVFSQPAPKIAINNGCYVSDAMAYLASVEQMLDQCLRYSRVAPTLGLCYQRSSFLIWNSQNGQPVTPLISWQDNRGQSSCNELQAHTTLIRQLTGLTLTPYFLAPKLRTLLQQQPELLQGIIDRSLLIGTLDSFLIWHWSGGKHYLTDSSMAARTLLMDIQTGLWSEPLCNIFNIPRNVLPEIYAARGFNIELNRGAVLQASVADQSAAVLASISDDGSEVLVNLGTGGFVMRYEPQPPSAIPHNYLRTLVYQDSQQHHHIAIEGTLNSLTAALQPYPYNSCAPENLAECDAIYCLAEPSGIGAPFFRSDIGLVFSKAVDHLNKVQIASLLLEGIIFRVALILEDFNQQAEISRVYIAGGLSDLPCLQQGLALCSPAPTYKLRQKNSGLQGLAILTHNLPAASFRQSEFIPTVAENHALIEKYQRWKVWFEHLISC